MDIVTLLSTDRIVFEPEVSSKKRAFEVLSGLLCRDIRDHELSADSVFDALTSREKLGSTALGNGIAIPHACMPTPDPQAAMLILEEGIKMDAPDKKPVHLLLALLVPQDNHEACRPLLRELTIHLNRRDLVQQFLQYREPRHALDYLSSLFIRDIAA
ncbi:MAG: PTS sugar transporter subunit IIA [Thiolinea sp.]